MGENAALVMEALASFKWWSLADLQDYLGIPTTNINTIIARHGHKFGVLSMDDKSTGTRRKLYRIKP